MKKQDEIYFSLDYEIYKNGKCALLNSQIDMLDSVKHLNSIKKIRAQKNSLKIKLSELLASVSQDLKSLDNNMPNPKIPKDSGQKNKSKKKDNDEYSELEYQENNENFEIDRELREIQEKLQRLNAN
ncbi:MAG: hypothetical protein ACOYT4_04880 [Nanoarchaeota archaeon]